MINDKLSIARHKATVLRWSLLGIAATNSGSIAAEASALAQAAEEALNAIDDVIVELVANTNSEQSASVTYEKSEAH